MPGRSPSTQPPPSPPSSGSSRPPRDSRPASPPSPQAALTSVARWGFLVGGLLIIVDLATRIVQQRGSTAPEGASPIDLIDLFINIILLSFLGAAVLRETSMVYLSVLAGMLAGFLDGLVIAASVSLAPRAGDQAPEEHILWNVILGAVFAGISAGVNQLVRRRSGQGPR